MYILSQVIILIIAVTGGFLFGHYGAEAYNKKQWTPALTISLIFYIIGIILIFAY